MFYSVSRETQPAPGGSWQKGETMGRVKASLDWNVQKYGIRMETHSSQYLGKMIQQRIYLYNETIFIETWCDGIRLHFHECI